VLSSGHLSVEEGSLYPALQKLLLKGWVKASPAVSETGRAVREYRITAAGKKQLASEQAEFRRTTDAIVAILETA
jgi:DNA-binding PadR family transcriptional regulator